MKKLLDAFAARHGLSDQARRELLTLALTGTSGSPSTLSPTAPSTLLLGDEDSYKVVDHRPTDRYQDLGPLGQGGMAEVRRAWDSDLQRPLAMKIIHADLLHRPSAVLRFVEEARLAARLQHPGIVPVHDVGRLPDGRLFFTMDVIRGRTLHELLHAVQHGERMTLRARLTIFLKVCEAMAFAHEQGVIHRDLKPANIMVGDFGRVLVMDWGVARALHNEPLADGDPAPAPSGTHTLHGAVVGTPGYMSPEQARGERDRVGPAADVWSLGAILHEILYGTPPVDAPAPAAEDLAPMDVDPSTEELPPLPAIPAALDTELAEELVALCRLALAPRVEERLADAGVLARAVRDWLDGNHREAQAAALVSEARVLESELQAMRERAAALRTDSGEALARLAPWEPVERKRPFWRQEDEAARLERLAAVKEVEYTQLLRLALNHAPEQAEARARLATTFQVAHARAELDRDPAEVARTEALLRAYDTGAHARYLRGAGRLTLLTEPDGAQAMLYRYDLQDRRLVLRRPRSLGRTPILDLELPIGSYLVELRVRGHHPVRYPVVIRRLERWDGVPPGAERPVPVRLPPLDAVPEDVCWVPRGWFDSGGDPEAFRGAPAQRVWVDGFGLARFPVTWRQYFIFLEDLLQRGDEDLAMSLAPRELGRFPGDLGPLIPELTPQGRYRLPPTALGGPDSPVTMVTWQGAWAYAAWMRQRTGLPWRLPSELEREKATRGPDGRAFPWGDFLDPTWCHMGLSHRGTPAPEAVDSYPVDESPYGVRGLAGNSRDWCADPWREEGPQVEQDRALTWDEPPPRAELHAWRGGFWDGSARDCRAATRGRYRPEHRAATLGIRLALGLGWGR